MKRYLLKLLRLLIALAGVAFIVWSLTWADELTLPAGHALVAAHDVEEPVSVRVIARPEQSVDGQWRVRLPAELGGGEAHLAPEAVGPEPGQVRHEAGVATTLGQANWWWLGVGLMMRAVQPTAQAM